MKKMFVIRNMHDEEMPLIKSDAACPSALMGVLNGRFHKNGKQLSSVLGKACDLNSNSAFVAELHNLVHFLQTDYANGMLSNTKRMREFCAAACEKPSFTESGKHVYGFETHSNDIFYFIRCTPREDNEDCRFSIFCYDRTNLIKCGFAKDNKEV